MILTFTNAEQFERGKWMADISDSVYEELSRIAFNSSEDIMSSIEMIATPQFTPENNLLKIDSEDLRVLTVGTLITDKVLLVGRLENSEIGGNCIKVGLEQLDFSAWSKFRREIEALSKYQLKLALEMLKIIREIKPKGYLKYNASTGWHVEEPGGNWQIKIQRDQTFCIRLSGSILKYKQKRINLNLQPVGKNNCKFVLSDKFQLSEFARALEEAKFN